MKRRALTLVELLAVMIFFLLLSFFLFFPNLGPREREASRKAMCGSNLRQVGMGMNYYANDNNGIFSMIDLGNGEIVGEDMTSNNIKPCAVENPFVDIPTDADRSISQNLWVFVRSGQATPKVFICPETEDIKNEFSLMDQKDKIGGRGEKYFVDFPHEKPKTTISYSFVQPWSTLTNGKKAVETFWSSTARPDLVMGADANNGSEPNYQGKPSQRKIEKYSNSLNHKQRGQNMVHIDGAVSFSKSPYTGIANDNIYTAQPKDYKGEAGQTAGVLSVRPKDQFDTVLIPNREEDLQKWDRVP